MKTLMMTTRPLVFLLISLCFALFSFDSGAAGPLLERTQEASSKDKNPVVAKAEMISFITERVSEELVKEIIGEGKYNRNKQLIASKILKQSARFIPFSKPGELQPLPEGFKMSLTVKISVDDLQALLLENGLFYESDGTPIVLPAIRIMDRVNSRSLAWWVSEDKSNKTFLIKEGKALEEQLKSSFAKNNFYLLRPQNLQMMNFLPASLKSENLSSEDWQRMAQRLGAPILIYGELTISKSQERSDAFTLALKMTALQVMNGRVIAEVARVFETDGGAFEMVVERKLKEILESSGQDLAGQVLEAWQKGALGASLYRLSIRGRLPLLQQEAFKEILKNKIREVKNIRERLISEDTLVFEVDSALSPKELAGKMPQMEVGPYQLFLESASETELIYRTKKIN